MSTPLGETSGSSPYTARHAVAEFDGVAVTRSGRDPLDRLTAREREVLALMAQGHSTIGIAASMTTSPKTVETQIASIFAKLDLPCGTGVNRRVLAVLTWLRGSASP